MDNQEKQYTPEEIAEVTRQLSKTPNNPETTMLECHCIDLSGLENGIKRSVEEWKETCKQCHIYKEFAAKHPNRIPNYEI